MSMKLYEIVANIREAMDAVTDEGEMAPGVEERLNQLDHDLTIKADNVAC